jgi:hypothetical protein
VPEPVPGSFFKHPQAARAVRELALGVEKGLREGELAAEGSVQLAELLRALEDVFNVRAGALARSAC